MLTSSTEGLLQRMRCVNYDLAPPLWRRSGSDILIRYWLVFGPHTLCRFKKKLATLSRLFRLVGYHADKSLVAFFRGLFQGMRLSSTGPQCLFRGLCNPSLNPRMTKMLVNVILYDMNLIFAHFVNHVGQQAFHFICIN